MSQLAVPSCTIVAPAPAARQLGLRGSAGQAVKETMTRGNEAGFTFAAPPARTPTSAVVAGCADFVMLPFVKGGGDFHTHPGRGFCYPSPEDFVQALQRNHREVMIGCPAEDRLLRLPVDPTLALGAAGQRLWGWAAEAARHAAAPVTAAQAWDEWETAWREAFKLLAGEYLPLGAFLAGAPLAGETLRSTN